MSESTSKLTILHHFLKIFFMVHLPLKPIACRPTGCDTSIIFYVRNEHFKSKYTLKIRIPCSIFFKLPPKPLAINQAAQSLFYR